MPSTCFELREQLHYLFFPCNPVGSPSWCLFLRYDIAVHPYTTATMLRFDTAVALYYGKALFWVYTTSHGNNCITCSFSCSPVGSPSWCLFLRYDIAAHPYATAIVLRVDTAVAPYCGKALFWAYATSQGNNCITCSFHAVLLGRLHSVCFCAMTLLRTLTPPRQCYVLTLQLPHTVEKRYFGGTLQAVGTSQMFMYPTSLLC